MKTEPKIKQPPLLPPSRRGGHRPGAGRPKGDKKPACLKTKVIRVPIDLLPDVESLIAAYRIKWHIPNAETLAAINTPIEDCETVTLDQLFGD
jgi:hypothetical protein